MDTSEAIRRHSFTKDIEAYFRKHESEWIPASALMTVGGRMAWRTRVADARRIFAGEGGVLQNQQTRLTDGSILSEYRYLAHRPLGRDPIAPMASVQEKMF